MSEAENDRPADERGILVRTYGVQAEMADERTLDVRVVPFDEVATVADPPDFQPYKEQFMPGVFSHQEKAANRILLRVGFGHDMLDPTGSPQGATRKPGFVGVIGHGQQLVGREDGYHARFKMHNNTEADTARELISDGVLTGVSAEFYPGRNIRSREGVIQRVRANLDSVLLTHSPAYSKAQVLAMREAEQETLDEEFMPPPPSLELLARVKAMGVPLPQGMAVLLDPPDGEAEDAA